MKKNFNKVGGFSGENSATKFLKNKKYKILAQNYKTKVGEVDIVALDGKTIVFIEVKMRETLAFGRPSEAVGRQKQAKIHRTAHEFLVRQHLLDSPVRFDVVEIVGEDINHIENAF